MPGQQEQGSGPTPPGACTAIDKTSGSIHGVGHSIVSQSTDSPEECSCLCTNQTAPQCLAWDWDDKSHKCNARATLSPSGTRDNITSGVVVIP